MTTYRINETDILKSTAENFEIECYSDGGALNPTSATYVLYNSALESLKTGSGSIDDNVITIPVTDDLYTECSENNKIVVTITTAQGTDVFTDIFDVVNQKIFNNVIDSDIEAEIPNIQDKRFSEITNYSGFIAQAFK